MSNDLTFKNILFWFGVGFTVAAGWTLGAWSMLKLIAQFTR